MEAVIFTQDYKRRGVLPVLSGKLTMRHNGVHDFELVINGNHPGWRRFTPGWRVRIEDHGQVLASGWVTKIEESYQAGVTDVTMLGVSDEAWLAATVTLPDPSKPPTEQTAEAYYKAKGPAETVIRDLIGRQIGPQAHPGFRRPLALTTDHGTGHQVTINTRYKNLLEEVQALARAGGVSFRIVQYGADRTSTLEFVDRQDLSRAVRLTEKNGTVAGFVLSRQAPEVTGVIVAGQGQGKARNIRYVTGNASDWGVQVVEFRDRRDTDDPAELTQAGTERLTEGQESASVTLKTMDRPGYVFGRRFMLGDTITVDLGQGRKVVDVVQTAEIEWSESGRQVTLQVGPVGDELDKPAWVKIVKRLQASVSVQATI